ncbi:Protein of unknown function [Faunimonas pinastri]|uniref:DUF2793 domain-containing protein n=1 Tax=Faunimonas pinastri TaxID=1855383 RepID=A0A1H9L2A4_9HYPH|nr:DUF2793 domain-containing protein [Faunimonas pinastri]SER05277.1 Protein of unknown function [Faunimonas pinastri]
MSETTNLKLPFLEAAQAQKHVTLNEALGMLDALVQLAVKSRDLTAPPDAPTDGDRYIVAADATGAWAGKDLNLASWTDGAWSFFAPVAGWLVWVEDENALLVWNGSAWVSAASGTASLTEAELAAGIPKLGIGTAADDANLLAAKLNAVLFTALEAASGGTGDIQFKVNKETAADTASLLFQTGYSGRAEMGLTGDDDFHVKVSNDGLAWTEAIRIEAASGRARLALLRPVIAATADYTLLPGDSGSLVSISKATATTLTLPADAPAGFAVTVKQSGAGQVTFAPASGATLESYAGHTRTAGQKAVARLAVFENSTGTAAVWTLDGQTAA